MKLYSKFIIATIISCILFNILFITCLVLALPKEIMLSLCVPVVLVVLFSFLGFYLTYKKTIQELKSLSKCYLDYLKKIFSRMEKINKEVIIDVSKSHKSEGAYRNYKKQKIA